MEATPVIARIFTAHKATQLFSHLDQIEIEYHKPYLRFNKPVKVPRGQASFTLDDTIHYSYKAAAGSPPNRVMDETLTLPNSPSNSPHRTPGTAFLGRNPVGFHNSGNIL